MTDALNSPNPNAKVYLHASLFEAMVSKWAQDLHHPIASHFMPQKKERDFVARTVKDAALSADLKFDADVVLHQEQSPGMSKERAYFEVRHTTATGLVLPIPGMEVANEGYVLVVGVYLEKKNHAGHPLAVALEDRRMKSLKIQSECAWIIPKVWLKDCVLQRSSLGFEPFALDGTGKIALRPNDKVEVARVFLTEENGFDRKVLQALEVKHPLLMLLTLTWGFKRLYRPELYFKENKSFAEEMFPQFSCDHADWQARVLLAKESHTETHFVTAHLTPSLMELTGVLLHLCTSPEHHRGLAKPEHPLGFDQSPLDRKLEVPDDFLGKFNKNFTALMHILDIGGMQGEELGSTGIRTTLPAILKGIEPNEPVYQVLSLLQEPSQVEKDADGDEIFNPTLNLLRAAHVNALNGTTSLLPQNQSPLRVRMNKGIKALVCHYSPFFSELELKEPPAKTPLPKSSESLQGGGRLCFVLDTAYALAQGINRNFWNNDPQLLCNADGKPSSLFKYYSDAIEVFKDMEESEAQSYQFSIQSVGIAPAKALLDFIAYSLLPMGQAFLNYEEIYDLD